MYSFWQAHELLFLNMGDAMRLQRAIGFMFLVAAQAGCSGGKDLTASALSQRLNGSAIAPVCVSGAASVQKLHSMNETKATTIWQRSGQKLMIEENRLRGSSLTTQAVGAFDPRIAAGTKLDIEFDVSCLLNPRTSTGVISQQVQFPKNLNPKGLDYWVASLELSVEVPTSVLSDWMEADECVNGADRSGVMKISAAPNDRLYTSQIYMNTNNLKATAAWDRFYDPSNGIKSDVIIAIIDSGVDTDHEDIAPRLWVNSDEIAGNGIDDDGNGYIDDINGYNMASRIPSPKPERWTGSSAGSEAHGTHVAGVAAAQEGNTVGIAGVNGKFGRIMGLNVFGGTPNATNENVAAGIDYARANGANIINMSLGGQEASAVILAAVNRATAAGVMVVVAAGNDNCDLDNPGSGTCPNGGANVFSPGGDNGSVTGGTALGNGFLSVGAINQSGGSRCSFSNHGSSVVEIAAPGCTGILSTIPGNQYVSQNWSGTSMASPLVAGGASLAYGLIRDRTGAAPSPALLEEVIIAGTRKVSSLQEFFEQGQVLDLVSLADEIDRRFPGSGAATPAPACP